MIPRARATANHVPPYVLFDPWSTARNESCTWRRVRFVVLLLASLLLLCGCSSIPKGAASVDDVRVDGNEKISSSDIEEKIATTPSPKFLGLFRGIIYDYELFDAGVLQRDLDRVERYYKSRGFYEAHARAGRVVYTNDKHVEVTIEVEEGKQVLVAPMHLEFPDPVTKATAKAVKSALDLHMKTGDPFEEDPFHEAGKAMKREMTDHGYAWAKIERKSNVDLITHQAYITFVAHAGPKAKFGKITIEGLKKLPLKPVLRATDIDPGEPYSTITLDRARDAVVALGTFSSVDVEPQLPNPPPADAVVPIVIKVQNQKLRSVLLGGGIELDSVRTEFHLHAGWEHKNLFGGFRHFTVDLKPGLDLYPTRLPSFQAPTQVLPEEKLSAALRQPGFIESRTVGVITQELNTYPLLLQPVVQPSSPVLGYLEYKGAAGLERTIWKFFGSPTYNFQYNFPFFYKGPSDPTLTPITISYIDFLTRLDFRDDRIRPHKGIFIQNDLQFAGLGGMARDFRIQPEVRGYIPLGRKVTIAARATVGFLFPLNYGGAVNNQSSGDVVAKTATNREEQLIFLRGFFSGGPSSNRGYPLRGVGPHGIVSFLNPGIKAAGIANNCADVTSDTKPVNSTTRDELIRCGVPLGGRSLWEASLELRFPIVDPLSAAVFCDTSDVSAYALQLRLNYPHLSCGAGLRYDTPVGPVRIDVGYRIPGAQYPKGTDLVLEGNPGYIYGVPLAVAFGLGESF